MKNNNNMLDGFYVPSSNFYDPVHYPYGISRSGDFTIKQSNILNILGRQLLALSDGQIAPNSKEERQFVEVCAGNRVAETDIEKTWQLYRYLTNKPYVVVGPSLMAS